MDKDNWANILRLNFRIGGKKRQIWRLNILATEYSLKSIADFHDRDLTSDGERKGLHCHDSRIRNPVLKIQVEAKSLNNQDFESRNIDK